MSKSVIIACSPKTYSLEDGTLMRTKLPIFWGTPKECMDMISVIDTITDWTLRIQELKEC